MVNDAHFDCCNAFPDSHGTERRLEAELPPRVSRCVALAQTGVVVQLVMICVVVLCSIFVVAHDKQFTDGVPTLDQIKYQLNFGSRNLLGILMPSWSGVT